MPPTVTAVRSLRGPGSRAATVAGWFPVSACTVATLAWSPPPKMKSRPPRVAPAASCVGAASRPAATVLPVTGSSRRTAVLDVACGVSPPAISRSGPCASTTSRESPPGSW